MPRFVILRHETPGPARLDVHWDFMLEQNGVLRTWALEREPVQQSGEIVAEALADHRLAYLDYEGRISENRGSVVRFDGGKYELEADSAGEISLSLTGEKIVGRVILRRDARDARRWLFTYCD